MFVNMAKVVIQISLKVKLWLMFVIVAKVGIESNFKLWLMFVIMPKGD